MVLKQCIRTILQSLFICLLFTFCLKEYLAHMEVSLLREKGLQNVRKCTVFEFGGILWCETDSVFAVLWKIRSILVVFQDKQVVLKTYSYWLIIIFRSPESLIIEKHYLRKVSAKCPKTEFMCMLQYSIITEPDAYMYTNDK